MAVKITGRILPYISWCMGNGGTKITLSRQIKSTNRTCLASNCRGLSAAVTRGVQVTSDGKVVELSWADGTRSRFHAAWLRHCCKCRQCYNPDSEQPIIYIHKLPMDIRLNNASITDDGNLSVNFKDGNHLGTFTLDFLRKYCYSNEQLAQKKSAAKINPEHVGVVPALQWSDVEDSEEGLYSFLKQINEYGICLLRNGSKDWDLVKGFFQKIGPIWDNTYGAVWDVESQGTPSNFAYTNKEMQYHMDLPFYQAMPGIEVLHCLRFDATIEGGQTLFVDITDVAENFRKDYPDEFHTLATVPVTFARVHDGRDHPIHMVLQRRIIQLNREQEIVAVFWNPTVTGPLQVNENEVEPFYRAYQLFAKQLYGNNKEMTVRLEPGETIIFNNRRLAHRRNAFHGEGDRHFRGVYIDICEYKSRLSVLSEKYGDGSPLRRVGNGDFF